MNGRESKTDLLRRMAATDEAIVRSCQSILSNPATGELAKRTFKATLETFTASLERTYAKLDELESDCFVG